MTKRDLGTDPGHLRNRSYADDARIRVRVETHERYTEPPGDFHDWVLSAIPWRGGERVIDVGCGAGSYAAPVQRRGGRYVAGDLSEGMLRALAVDVPRIVLDAHQPGLADGCADVVLANHVLYHFADQARAVAALGRLLAEGGVLLAATNARDATAGLRDLPTRALERLGQPPLPADAIGCDTFSLENGGAVLEAHFRHVDVRVLDAELVFPEPDPVVAYLDSVDDWIEARLPGEVRWERLRGEIRALVAEEIADAGVFRVGKRACAFICRDPLVA